MASIKRRRTNTYADELTVTSESGAIIDITDCTFVMHVTTDKAPDALTTNLLYTVTGTIIGSPTLGRVEFAPTLQQATQDDGTYYYEVVMTDTASRTPNDCA